MVNQNGDSNELSRSDVNPDKTTELSTSTPTTENVHLQQEPTVDRSRGLSFRAEYYGGPLPAPSILKAYDMVSPGLAERIVAQAENQSQHRMQLEKTVVENDIKRANWGLGLGFAFAIFCYVLGGLLIWNNHDWAGASIISVNTVSIVVAFVYGSNNRKQERMEKQQNLLDMQSGRK